MIVLGQRHEFTKAEKKQLLKMGYKLYIIAHKDIEPSLVLKRLKKAVSKNQHQSIVLNTKASVDNSIISYLTNLRIKQNVNFITIESFLEKYLKKCYIPTSNIHLDYLEDIKPYNAFEYIQKRIVDIFFCVFIGILSLPLVVLSLYKIKKQSPGDCLFKQSRVGINDKEFTCMKLRSMGLDAEKEGIVFASKNDDRTFAWGEVMRKTRIDELPQILNVLKGDMHLIGPRPERKFWVEQFEKSIPFYSERHIVKPGITGWAQVMYPYGQNAHDAKQKLMYDLYYIKHWNIFFELKIAFLTALTVFKKAGL